jgi:magnesium transporter
MIMITYWQMIRSGLLPLSTFEKGSIINVTTPTEKELNILRSTFKVPDDFIHDIMDIDERSRLEVDEGRFYIIYRIPVHNSNNGIPYSTIPLGIVLSQDYMITVSSRNCDVLDDFFSRSVKNIELNNYFELILHLFIRTTFFYHRYLKQINQNTNLIEQELAISTKNKELHKLLNMEKCLVYFTTSLRSNDLLITKLKNSKFIVKNDSTISELFDETLVENRQAIEMANIYSDIQSGMMDAFASVISNNLNMVMKQLTIVTIMLMIPTLIASFFGMNVPNFMETNKLAFAGILISSVLLTVMGVLLFKRKKWM